MTTSRVLSRLTLKNWHSVHEATIGLTPLTVFIGANSSGKSNIIDALHFIRQAANGDVLGAFDMRGGIRQLATFGHESESVEIKLAFTPFFDDLPLEYAITSEQVTDSVESARFSETLRGQDGEIWLKTEGGSGQLVHINVTDLAHQSESLDATEAGLSALGRTSRYPQIQHTYQFFTKRWQLLDEALMPVPKIRFVGNPVESLQIDPRAINTAYVIKVLQNNLGLFPDFQADLSYLLSHVDGISINTTDDELEIQVQERPFHGEQARSISSGTLRTIAMLTAYYALDMRSAELPGLVIIEEPDAGVHPLLLKRLVEQMRDYVSRSEPRQFILTTHNPMFLNYFEPEEVRIVTRDEHGLTTVSGIDQDLAQTWFESEGAYNLGDLWTTRLMGGVPE